VQIQGTVETITDPEAIYQLGLAIGNVMGNALAGAGAAGPVAASTVAAGSAVNDYVANAARKRYGYVVEPHKVISWDHSKLVVPAG
jgi:hypothetical protein